MPIMLLAFALGATTPASPARDPSGEWFGTGGCLTGFCPRPARSGPPSGVMFISVGLVGFGAAELWRERNRRRM